MKNKYIESILTNSLWYLCIYYTQEGNYKDLCLLALKVKNQIMIKLIILSFNCCNNTYQEFEFSFRNN